MKKFFSFTAIGFFSFAFAQEQISFENEVASIDSLLNAEAFEVADQKLISLQNSVANTSLGKEDTVRLYFTSKRAFIASLLGDCENTIQLSKEDVALRKEVYGTGSALTLSANRNLGIYYINCDSLSRARHILSETLTTHKSEIGVPDEVYARTLDDLAFVEGKLGNLEQAIRYYDELLDLLGAGKGAFYQHTIENYSALLISNEKFEEASSFFDDLLSSMKENKDYPVFLKDYYNVFVHLKDYRKALETSSLLADWCQIHAQQCEEMAIDEKEYTLSSARLAMLLFRYDDAESYYKKAERFYKDSVEYPRVLLEQATLYSYISKRYDQLSSLNKIISYHRSTFTTDSTSYDEAVFKLGTLYTKLGRFNQANELFKNYLSDLENSSVVDPVKLGMAYQSLGNQRLLLQNFKDADSYYAKAKALFEEGNLTKTKEYVSLLNSYGALYEALANYDRAESYYRIALSSSEDDAGTLRTTLASNLANVLIRVNPSNDSIEFYLSQAITWQQDLSGENHPQMANLYASRGVYYLKKNLLVPAETDLKEACRIFEYTVAEDHPQYLAAISNLGLIYDANGINDLAETTLLEAARLYEKYYNKTNPGYIRALNNLANYYARIGKYEEAEPLYVELSQVQMNEIANSFTYLSDSEKKNFVTEKQKLLNNFKNYIVIRSLSDDDSIDKEVVETWYNLELSTKGILLNSTRKVRESIFSSGDEDLIALFSEWTLARKQIADLQSLKSSQSANTQARYDSLSQAVNELEKELTRKSSAFSKSFTQKNPTYDDLRSQLGPNEAIMEIIRTEINGSGVYTALVGTRTMEYPDLIVVGKGDDLEERGFKVYKNSISFKVADSRSFDLYWKKIDDYLTNASITKIFYAPDGVYHKLNPNTFFHRETENYILDELEIVQLSSTKDLLTKRSESEVKPAKALLIGRPTFKDSDEPGILGTTRSFELLSNVSDLPGTEEEVLEIRDLFEKRDLQTDVLINDQAQEQEVKKQLNRGLVHIATHGFFISDNTEGRDPMLNSGLLLAGVSNERKVNDEEDGILTAYEIMNLSLSDLNLVVLSACETGLGEIASGEGIYGLQRAFFIGGAQTLVMSLWKVDDTATRDLMIEFYKEYLKGSNRKEAFTAAQRKIKKKYKDPIYWGAFVMIGS